MPSQPPGFQSWKGEDAGHFSKTDCKLVTSSPNLLLAMSWFSFLLGFMVYSSHSVLFRDKLHGFFIQFLALTFQAKLLKILIQPLYLSHQEILLVLRPFTMYSESNNFIFSLLLPLYSKPLSPLTRTTAIVSVID